MNNIKLLEVKVTLCSFLIQIQRHEKIYLQLKKWKVDSNRNSIIEKEDEAEYGDNKAKVMADVGSAE